MTVKPLRYRRAVVLCYGRDFVFLPAILLCDVEGKMFRKGRRLEYCKLRVVTGLRALPPLVNNTPSSKDSSEVLYASTMLALPAYLHR